MGFSVRQIDDTTDNSFSHYGILGMKWGVRRTPEQLGHRTKPTKDERKTRKRLSEDYRIIKSGLKSSVFVRDKETKEAYLSAHRKAKKALEDYVEELNKKYGEKNVKQIKPDTIRLGRETVEAAYKTPFLTLEQMILPPIVSAAMDGRRLQQMLNEEKKKR